MDDGLRASDADRDRAAAQLQVNFAAGRLTRSELDDRLSAALAARTFGDLRRSLAGLPGLTPAPHRDGSLERGYRRLLACYPRRYRRVHEEEILAVLMTAAPEGKRRPGLAEAADLIVGALRVWCQPSRGGMAGWRGALALASVGAVLGLLAGIASAAANPPRPAPFTAVVRIQPEKPGWAYSKNPLIFERAALRIRPAISLQALQRRVQISRMSPRAAGFIGQQQVVVISAQAARPVRAIRFAQAVADSYMQYVSGRPHLAIPRELGYRFGQYYPVTHKISPLTDILDTGGLGALCGALIGAIGAVARSRPSRRFRMT